MRTIGGLDLRLWTADAVLSVAILMTAFDPGEPGPPTAMDMDLDLDPVTLVILGAVVAVLPLRRRWPFSVLTAVLVLTALSIIWGEAGPGTLLACAAVVFRIAHSQTRPRTAAAAAYAVVGLTVIGLFTVSDPWEYPWLIPVVTVIGFAAAAGDAVRHRRSYIAAITERAERAEQERDLEAQRRVTEERLRIARELHDAAAHQIAAINLYTGVATNALPDRPEDAQRALAVISDAARTVLGEISTMLSVLRSGEDGAPVPQPVADLDTLPALVEDFRRIGLEVDLEADPEADPAVDAATAAVPGAVGVVAYKIIQEALTNAHKHGTDRRAVLVLAHREGVLSITARNRVGLRGPATAPAPGGGHGLIGIRERVHAVGGDVSAGEEGGEFVLRADLPTDHTPLPKGRV